MKLHYDPVSTTSRPILLFAADHQLALDHARVDLMAGAHLTPEFARLNPSQQVPVLEDGDFRLTECSAILKYLADRCGSPAYPSDLQQRARVNACMDWLNTGFLRDVAYGMLYPQIFPNHRRPSEQAQADHLAWSRGRAERWLAILDEDVIGDQTYLCGEQVTLADYLGIAMLTLGEVVRQDYGRWPRVARWIEAMKARPSFAPVHQAFYEHFVPAYSGIAFAHIGEDGGAP